MVQLAAPRTELETGRRVNHAGMANIHCRKGDCLPAWGLQTWEECCFSFLFLFNRSHVLTRSLPPPLFSYLCHTFFPLHPPPGLCKVCRCGRDAADSLIVHAHLLSPRAPLPLALQVSEEPCSSPSRLGSPGFCSFCCSPRVQTAQNRPSRLKMVRVTRRFAMPT